MPSAFSLLVQSSILLSSTKGQSATVDWVYVDVGADGAPEFGPQVRMPAEHAPPIVEHMSEDGTFGYFVNADGFYGRGPFKEYLLLRRGSDSRLEAMKVVGDANVPRGQLSFRTRAGALEAPTWSMPVQLRLRDDPGDENGFWWSPDRHHDLRWESDLDAFNIVGQNPNGEHRSLFYRVAPEEALQAADTIDDAP